MLECQAFHVVGRLMLVRGAVFSEQACEPQHIDVTEHSTPSSAPLGSLIRARWAAESASRHGARDTGGRLDSDVSFLICDS